MADPATIPEALARAERSPRGITFLDASGEVGRWTYGELGEAARRAAGALASLGVGPGDRVGLLGSTTPGLVSAIFGCWASGVVAVPLAVPMRLTHPEGLAEEVRFRLQRAGARVLVTDDRLGAIGQLSGIAETTVTLSELAQRGRELPFAPTAPDDLALIQFTSGSTARPRGVMLSHRCLVGNGLAAREHCRITPNDVAVSWLPLYHDFGLIGLTLWPLLYDIPAYLMGPEVFVSSPRRWLEALSRYGGTITAAPNFAYGLAARALRSGGGTLDLSRLRIAANGAEPVDPQTTEEFAAAAAAHGLRASALLPVYGLAEATLGVSAPPPGAPPPPCWVDAEVLASQGLAVEAPPAAPASRPLVSVGLPIPGVEVDIRGPGGERLGPGRVGEVCVRSEFAMLGYWDDPAETARVLVDGWIRTGDLGLWGPNGLYICGRIKDLIIVAGRNLYPEDAERAAAAVPGVRRGNAVAFGIVRRAREALVVAAETRLVGEEAVRLARQVAAQVRRAMRVAAHHVVLLPPGTLPKTPSGKLQRRLTRRLYEGGQLLSQAVATAGRALGRSPDPGLANGY